MWSGSRIFHPTLAKFCPTMSGGRADLLKPVMNNTWVISAGKALEIFCPISARYSSIFSLKGGTQLQDFCLGGSIPRFLPETDDVAHW